MAESKDMSAWIKFFTGAGIPPGPASTYAVTFIDNRIKRSMLIDLSKEYLKDMGISVMGDIISILKHGKSVHAREEREKPALSALPSTPDGKVEIKRQTTPGSRMLEHYLRKEGIDIEPEPTVKVTTEMAARLGAVPKTGSKSALDISQIKQVEVKPIKKARKISPEPDVQQKAQKESDAKKSVFARLGGGKLAGGNLATTGGNSSKGVKRGASDTQVTVTGLDKDMDTSSVFKRLGDVKRQKTVSVSSDDGSVLEYCGVLKPGMESMNPGQQTVTVILGGAKPSPLQSRLGAKVGESKAPPQMSTTKMSILDRLGPQRSGSAPRLGTQKSEATSSTGAPVKITRTISNTEKTTSIQERLGPQKAEASSTSDVFSSLKSVKKANPASGINIKDRLGAKNAETVTMKKLTIKKGTGVVKRLGTQTKSTAVAQQQSTATKKTGLLVQLSKKQAVRKEITRKEKNPGAVLGRLGLPIYQTETSTVTAILTKPKLSSVRDRLGTQKAEVTSTTPTTTKVIAKKVAGKKIVRMGGIQPSTKVSSITIAAHVGSLRQASAGKATSSSGVFSRLGAKSS